MSLILEELKVQRSGWRAVCDKNEKNAVSLFSTSLHTFVFILKNSKVRSPVTLIEN